MNGNRESRIRGERRLLVGSVLGVVAAIGIGVAPLPAAARSSMSSAEKLRRLDIMLMVTGLRCRTTADNFQADYARFSSNHLGELNAANAQLRSEFRARGASNADRALDHISVTMANDYGSGHPWLNCAQLKQVTRGLAQVRGTDPLIAAADQLLDSRPSTLLAYGGR